MASIFLTNNSWYNAPAEDDVDLNNNTIINVATPVNPYDVATKAYVDASTGGVVPNSWSTFPATTAVDMATFGLNNVGQISNTSGTGVILTAGGVADANHRITVQTGNIELNSASLTSAVNINGGQNITLTANANGDQTAGLLTLQNKTNSMTLNTAGVGIGVSNPVAKLHINQSNAVDCMRVEDVANDTTYFKIDQHGNVGIKTGDTELSGNSLVVNGSEVLSNMLTVNNPGNNYANATLGSAVPGVANSGALTLYQNQNVNSRLSAYAGDTNYLINPLAIGSSNANNSMLYVLNGGSGDSIRIDDQAADTTYFKIDQHGNVGIQTGSDTLTLPLTVKGDIGLNKVSGPHPTISLNGSNSGVTTACNITAKNGSINDRSMQFFNLQNVSDGTGAAFRFIGGDGNSNPILEMYPSKTAKFYGAIDAGNQSVINVGLMGVGTSTPSAKLHVIQEAGSDCVRVEDQASDNTYFRVDANGNVGVQTSSTTLTKALTIGSGASDLTSALKINGGNGDKFFLTYLDEGSRISQLPSWGFQFTAGIDTGASNNQGFFSWRTGGVASFVERMRLENNGQLNTMNNKIINVGTPTNATDGANKSYVDSMAASGSAGWSLNPATSTINAASYKITNLGNPTNSGDAVNIGYLNNNYFNPKGGNCHYVEASVDNPGTDYTVNLANSPFNDIFVNVCLKNGYTKNIYWTNNNNTNLQGRRVHVSVSSTSDASASGRCYYLDGSGSYYDISLNSSNRVLVFAFTMGYTGLNDVVLESSRTN